MAFNLYQRFHSYHHRMVKVSGKPEISSIEITNDCNLNCEICAREQVKNNRGIGYMALKQFKFIIEKYRPRHPRLFLHGEPTLHPDLVEMVSICRANGSDSVGFTTNGVLMTPDLFKQCVDAGLTVIAFSYAGTIQYLEEICQFNAEIGSPINISMNVVLSKKTQPILQTLENVWRDVKGFNGITVTQMGNWGGTHNTTHLEYAPPHIKPVKICSAAWFIVEIYYNGDIAPCCTWIDEPFGNIFTDELNEVWNSPKYKGFRKMMLRGRSKAHPFCRNCRANPFQEGSPYLEEQNPYYPFTRIVLETFVMKPIRRRLVDKLA